ncbi:uncharacterized protein TNCV_3511991 [Trichonephila clavipes]|nr:uncharacterized protein TNCV_3511991 [Trichonephila clavipes]
MVSWEYLRPTLRCRREEGVSPLLSIGWWYLSSVSPKSHCCRVSAADKGFRVNPLDPHPGAVSLYSRCTPGKCRAWFCQMTSTLPPLLDSLVGGGTPERRCLCVLMDPMLLCPGISGDLKSVRKLRSGDLLIETASAVQSKYFLMAKTFLDSTLTVTPNKSLNCSRGVISESDLLSASETEILEELSD